MPYYKICKYCGATLDPNEKCNCDPHNLVKNMGDEVREYGIYKALQIDKNDKSSTTNY